MASSAPAASSRGSSAPTNWGFSSSRAVSSTATRRRRSPAAAGARSADPTNSRSTLGRPGRSRAPAPVPTCSSRNAGGASQSSTSVASSAAPVGVVSSPLASPISTGSAAQQPRGRRRGHGDRAVRRRDAAAPQPRRRRVHALQPQVGQAQHGPGHVHERVGRAHLVEVDLLDAGAVHRRLRLGQPAEHRDRPRRARPAAGPRGRGPPPRGPGAGAAGPPPPPRPRPGPPPAGRAAPRSPRRARPRDRAGRAAHEPLRRPAGRDERPQRHVAADPRTAVEPADAHDRAS